MFAMLSVLAELQRELILANTRGGLAAARARGRMGGRRPRLNAERVALAQLLYDAGDQPVQQIADLFSVPRTAVYGHLDDASKGKRLASRRKPKSPEAASAG
jgi:DNA invertase Pin-like site-specific DNA recombinase